MIIDSLEFRDIVNCFVVECILLSILVCICFVVWESICLLRNLMIVGKLDFLLSFLLLSVIVWLCNSDEIVMIGIGIWVCCRCVVLVLMIFC